MSERAATVDRNLEQNGAEALAVVERKYLYAIVLSNADFDGSLKGVEEAPVYTLAEGRVAAVVSDLDLPRLRPERRYLAAHQGVLRELTVKMTLLPISFGTVADSDSAVRRILRHNQQAFLGQLRRVAGKLEMGLRVSWDVPNLFEYFVNTHPELRAARDRFFGGGHETTHEEKIEVGRLFERLLEEDRENYAEKVEAVLSPHCFEMRQNKCRQEKEVLNAAYLVGRGNQEVFEACVFGAAQLFDNNFAFDYNGPWPPYDFVEVDLEL